MSIVIMIIAIVVLALVMAAINRWLGPHMDPMILRILNIAVWIALVVWLLGAFGVWGYLERIKVGA